MGEAQSRFDMAEYKERLDAGIADVMPDDWLGHARVKIASEGFSGKRKTFAEKLTRRLVEKKDLSAERAAELSIEKAKEKF